MRNRVLTIIFCLMLSGPILLWCVEKAGIVVPTWLSAAEAKYLTGTLSGETKEVNLRAAFNPSGFSSGKLQSTLAEEVENRIPLKASLMLTSASAQRAFIQLADLPFGWKCYPTFFGSKMIYVPEYDSLGYIPAKRDAKQLELLRELASNASRFAAAHPNVRVCMCVALGYRDAAMNPARDLVANPSMPGEQLAAIQEVEGSSSDFLVVGETYEDMRSYFDDYFRTDIHWNWRGTERAYKTISSRMGLNSLGTNQGRPIEDYKFSGAIARWALDLVEEDVSYSEHEFSDLEVVYPDGKKEPFGHAAFDRQTGSIRKYGFYGFYYLCYPSETSLLGKGSGHALVIANSFGATIAPYVAQNYSETIELYHAHPSFKDASYRLSEHIDETGETDLFVVGTPTDLASFAERCPNYFE